MSSNNEIALRLLERCARIEESKRKIDEQVQLSTKAPIDLQSYKEQMEQVRIDMLASQESARMKMEHIESEIGHLKAELDALGVQKQLLAAVEGNREKEEMELNLKLTECKTTAEETKKKYLEAHQENTRLRSLVKAIQTGDTETVEKLIREEPTPVQESRAKTFFQNLGMRFKTSPIVKRNATSQSTSATFSSTSIGSGGNNTGTSQNVRTKSSTDCVPNSTENTSTETSTNEKTASDETSTGSLTDETADDNASVGAEEIQA